MPQEATNKIIRDVVHGYIPLTANDIKVIDTPHFQRLRHIKQTGAHSVYPSANHTRFEHSLGVMYLGTRVLDSLELDVDTRLSNTLRYACLLHDIGHAPFSHLGEYFYDSQRLTQIIKDTFSERGITTNIQGSSAAPHELCSCAIALQKYGDTLVDLEVDLDLMCRMILGEQYGMSEKKREDSLISILNSTADVDKFDYILRDTYMSGSQLTTIDTERLISAYKIYNNKLVFSGKAISTISNLVYGRSALYTWVYNHHVTVYTDSVLKRLLTHLIENDQSAKKRLFSYEAVSEELADDHDVIAYLRGFKDFDGYSKSLYDQYFYRNFFKSAWKTIFAFEELIYDRGKQDDFIKAVGEYRRQQKGLEKLETRIINSSEGKLKEGDFYIAVADFKPFVPVAGKSIYILIKEKLERFEDIFHTGIFSKPYPELPHVFVRNDETKRILLDILNKHDY